MINGSPFQFIEEDPWIACVGVNGGTSDYDIFRGFADAVDVIYHAISEMEYAEDVMVYPMAFSARHCIELGLKISIHGMMDFLDFPKLSGRVGINADAVKKGLLQHDISILGDVLVSLLPIDSRLVPYGADIVPYLKDYYFDKKGDMFRYAESRDNTLNLAGSNIAHVGLKQLHRRFRELLNIFERLYTDIERVYDEYRTGSHTAHLSRADLDKIAGKLPDRSKWGDGTFDRIKDALRSEYNIGSHELSEAINIIQSVPEFSIKIGVEKRFRNIPEKELEDYRKLAKCYRESVKGRPHIILAGDIAAEMIGKEQKRSMERAEWAKNLSPETLNCLFAFYLLAKEGSYAEKLQEYYEYVAGRDFDKGYLISKLEKEDIFLYVKKGMEICGQEGYLKKIM